MSGMEDVRKAVQRALLSSEFKAELLGVYTSQGEAELVEYPRRVHLSQKFNVQEYPCIEISGAMTRNTRNDSVVKDLLYEVHIFWHERGDDEEVLESRVNRAMLAIRNYFEKHQYFWADDLQNAPLYLGDDAYSPFVPEGIYEGRPFLKSAMVQLYVELLG